MPKRFTGDTILSVKTALFANI